MWLRFSAPAAGNASVGTPQNATRSILSPTAVVRVAFVVLTLLTALHSRPRNNANILSRLATTQALVENGTLEIDRIPYTPTLIDKVFAKGHFYSDKPPAISLLGAAIYYPLYRIGFKLEPRKKPVPVYPIITLILIGLSSIICLSRFARALVLVGVERVGASLMSAGLAFCTLLLPWSTTLNNHAFSGAWTFVGFYFVLKAELSSGDNPRRSLLCAGAALGLAAAADSACILFLAGFWAYILRRRGIAPALLWYSAPAFLITLPGIIINYSITGDLWPAAGHRELFLYPGAHWTGGSERLSGVTRNSLHFAVRYAIASLFGKNGFLLYNPLLLVAIYEGARLFLRRAFL